MIYFDNAATTYPKPGCVISAVNAASSGAYGNPGRGGHRAAMAAAELVYEARVRLALLFGTLPERVCFTGGCTAALNQAILGLLRRGERVMTSDIEHNSVMRPLYASGAEITTFPAFSRTEEILGRINDGINNGVSCVVCTCASNVFPLVLPYGQIGALCRDRGVVFIADGAQAAGVYDINVGRDNIDVLCVPSHKGLYGVTGCGALILSADFDAERLRPVLSGGSGVNSAEPFMPKEPPERFEAGTLPVVPVAALAAGAGFVLDTGVGTIRACEERICRAVLDGLSGADAVRFYRAAPGTLLCFNIEGKSCEETADLLDGYGICVRAGLHCAPSAHKYTAPDGTGAVRVSFSYFNTENQAKAFCEAVRRLSRL
ncbi:MAG: aminotransferase class V-fold PLP-dependent enzyme [Clostridia bacterium]|nr:aminotransferase class V-fold PLP-dependent enzyme [Clostridia bacterium]